MRLCRTGWIRKKEASQYYVGQAQTHGVPAAPKTHGVRRVVQRLDGFVSADAGWAGAEFTTPLLTFTGDRLSLNVDCSAMGEVWIEIRDDWNHPIENYSMDEAISKEPCQLYWNPHEIDDLRGYAGIEIVNGYFLGEIGGIGVLATDVWDHLLTQGKLAWGFASDDFHKWHHLAQAWTMIYARSRSHHDIQAAIQQGSFYCSTGLTLANIELTEQKLKISARRKDTLTSLSRYIFIGDHGAVLDRQQGEYGEYRIRGDETYVRVEIESQSGAKLWTQPIYKHHLKPA